MACELCGKETQLVHAIVEGSEMTVCPQCSKFGKILKKPITPQTFKKKTAPAEPQETLIPNFAELIRKSREKTGMTQQEFANKLNEKESIIQKLETGNFTPTIEMAKKLEKILKIKLVEIEEDTFTPPDSKKSGTLTIGDFIKIKNK